ncbi:MAG: hypothetical protein ACTHJ0_09765 [Flavipsychrobacter sp.]
MFVLKSSISIGVPGKQLQFTGVHQVVIKKSIHSYIDTATIMLPSISYLRTKINSSNPQRVITGNQFNDGDPISISLGYNDDLKEEFRGFIKRRNLNMPLEIECEGYSYRLRRNNIKGSWPSISVKDLLEKAVDGLGITLQVNTDISLSNVVISNWTAAQVIDFILKETDGCISIFFIQPNVLWAGLVYTPCSNGNDTFNLSTVKYKLGYNVVKDNSLKVRVPEDDAVKVNFSKKLSTGEKLSESSSATEKTIIRNYRKLLNHIAASPILKALALEKQKRFSYIGYEGRINAFLQPYALPGYKAYIEDTQYAERNGTYLVEGIEVVYGIRGARRIIDIGPQISK